MWLAVNAVLVGLAFGALRAQVQAVRKTLDRWEERGTPGEKVLRERVDGLALFWRDRADRTESAAVEDRAYMRIVGKRTHWHGNCLTALALQTKTELPPPPED